MLDGFSPIFILKLNPLEKQNLEGFAIDKMDQIEIAKAVWEYKRKMEEEEELERVRFNKCYSEASKKLRKEHGLIKFVFTKKSSWDNIAKLAWIIYKAKYGELKDKGGSQ